MGEAVVVEVMPGKWLFALIDGSDSVLRTANGWPEAAYGLSRAPDGRQRDFQEQMSVLGGQPLDTPVPLPPEAWPMLVTFDDIAKPETVRKVDPENLAAVFGEGVRLKAVTLEITGEAVTEGLVETMPFWKQLVEQRTFSGLHFLDPERPASLSYLTYDSLKMVKP